ncbi:putative sodium-coupled neutral amino acid transporter 7 [Bagarius yarrelli]|uniref:Sodium-coupled neutral amino acid transporter 7 n=1 Tax=Bagarius yarrelli TaxID=175774 RepID=A0A556U340_BAGYA|nr:putative sodium-coupled neutral amino acid transporter 7 [Bagarius yarrelli]
MRTAPDRGISSNTQHRIPPYTPAPKSFINTAPDALITQHRIPPYTQHQIAGISSNTQHRIPQDTQHWISGISQTPSTGFLPTPSTGFLPTPSTGFLPTPSTGFLPTTQHPARSLPTHRITGSLPTPSTGFIPPYTQHRIPPYTRHRIPPYTQHRIPPYTQHRIPPYTQHRIPPYTQHRIPPYTQHRIPPYTQHLLHHGFLHTHQHRIDGIPPYTQHRIAGIQSSRFLLQTHTASDSSEHTALDLWDTSEHAAPDSSEHAAPDSSEHAAPDSSEHAAPDSSEHAAPDSSEHAAPDRWDSSKHPALDFSLHKAVDCSGIYSFKTAHWLGFTPLFVIQVMSFKHLKSHTKGRGPKGEPPGRTSALGAVFIVVNAALGAGLLNFPAAFYMAGGVVSGVVLQMVSNESTYQEVVRAVCGKVLGTVCEIAIAVYTFGTCIAFLIIIGDQLDKLITAMAHEADGAVSSHCTFSVIGTWYVTAVIIIRYVCPDGEINPAVLPTRRVERAQTPSPVHTRLVLSHTRSRSRYPRHRARHLAHRWPCSLLHLRLPSWHALVIYGILMVTVGTFIFGQTTTNAIYRDLLDH